MTRVPRNDVVDCAGFGAEGPPCGGCPNDNRCPLILGYHERAYEQRGRFHHALCEIANGRVDGDVADFARAAALDQGR